MSTAQSRDPIAKALSALTWLVENSQDVGVRELANALKVSPSSAHRILGALMDVGFVRQDAASSRYSLGLEFLRLCHITTSKQPVRQLAYPHMKALADQCGETVVLGLYDRDHLKMMFASEALPSTPFALRYVIQLDTWIPVYAGATGLGIMAFLPNAQIQAIIRSTGLRALTDKTITAPDVLVKELRATRNRGYAISRGQRMPDAGAIAAPVFSSRGEVLGDIAIALPKQRLDTGREKSLALMVMKCANSLTADLGGNHPVLDDLADLNVPVPR
ncbi:MAG: IclR family transcriptional regulator [Gammaproteobacteria bacterium]